MDEPPLDEVTKRPKRDPKKAPLTDAHQEGEFRHVAQMEFQMLRYPGEWSKMLFHPRPERPTEPNAGIVKFDPGAHHPLHSHYFAQVWYVLEGQFKIGEQLCGPGTMIYYPDPHFERPLSTQTGGLMLFVQYPGPTTGKPPVYEGRFNVGARRPLEDERYDW